MKSIKKLEENYQKEVQLADKHRQNAADIRKEIELLKGSMINQRTKALNLNGAEYDQFLKLLESDKRTVLEAIGLVLGDETVMEVLETGKGEKDEDAQEPA